PKEHRTGGETAAVCRALDEAAALERSHEARGRALRQAGVCSELADGDRAAALDDADEQLRGTVYRLGSGLGRHLTSSHRRSEMHSADAAAPRKIRAWPGRPRNRVLQR